ncbi:hypothetical protein [Calothrix sp. 336/3]|uniref:hypothetical protein n=1 Tax=Calothrix sp. 336/3 TaxID=1337936 RepID=UPI0004E2FFEC|nr:hypothetical protein [Calothrix sp. 336/3]AKG19980.1 hypothetical protein IJ00_00420 [Calothrix sp. 336/3]
MVRLLQQKKKPQGSALTLFAIATFSLQFLVLLLIIIQGLTIRQYNLRKPPNFVQLVDGKPVTNTSDLAREPEAIRQFISKTMIAMFNWSGKLPAQNIEDVAKPKADTGITIPTTQGGVQKITTSTWVASFALSEDFRKGFLSKIAEITPPEVFSNNPKQAITVELIIKRVYPPVQISPGKWRVGMVADLIQRKENRQVITPFNKDLLVKSVDYFAYPVPENISNLQQAIYSVRSEKLEIYEIRNLCLIDGYNENNPDKLQRCGGNQKLESFIKSNF